jgi:hypothetical protein
MEIIVGHPMPLHFLLGPERDGCEAAILENSADFGKPLQGVGPEIDSVNCEDAIESGCVEGKVRDVPELHAYAALGDLAVESALGLAD